MPAEKQRSTAFDALAAALAPAMIIGMIGSLVFFLVIAFYRGDYDVRLMYILGLYTVATVLIARIAIESGRMHAALFAAPLALVAVLAMFRFVTLSGEWAALSGLANVGLLVLCWYLADRITYDCTLLEEDRESLQGGLLQTLGDAAKGQATAAVTKSAPNAAANSGKLLKKARHNPGVWVLYFALIAFPLFGLGQLVIPDERQRWLAFWLLASYLGCALALLMTTSLLGLRRYLRQRGTSMPGDMTARWLVTGAGIIIGVLLLSLLLPLPGRAVRIAGIPIEFKSPDGLQSSRMAWGNDGQEGQAGASQSQSPSDSEPHQPKDQQPADQTSDQSSAESSSSNQSSGNQSSSDKSSSNKSSSNQSSSNQSSSDNSSSNQSSDNSSSNQSSDNSSSDKSSSDKSSSSQSNGANKGSDRQSSAKSQSANQQPPRSQKTGDQNSRNPNENDQNANDQNANDQNANDQNANGQPANEQRAGQRNEREPGQGNQPQQKAADRRDDAAQDASGSAAQGADKPLRAGDSLSQASKQLATNLSQSFQGLGDWFKWLLIVILAAVVLIYAVTHPAEILRLWRDLVGLLNLLLGRQAKAPTVAVADSEPRANAAQSLAFVSLANPFRQNLKGWSAARVVEHTFVALEAWAAEYGVARKPEQTADEFAKTLVARLPQLEGLPLQAASMLDRLMFASWKPTPHDLGPLEELWRTLERHPAPRR